MKDDTLTIEHTCRGGRDNILMRMILPLSLEYKPLEEGTLSLVQSRHSINVVE